MGRKKLENNDMKAFSIRIRPELHAWLAENAKREHRSLNAQVVIELERRMNEQQSSVTLAASGTVGKPSE